jgi:outer membrane protein assembly factor BamD
MFSCATDKPTGKTEAEVLFKEAKVLVKEERYILATEKLNNLKNQYPYSYYATPAELLNADILFSQENYVESAAAFMLFRDFHPKHDQIAYVIYKIAESYYLQLPDTDDRDLDAAVEAIKYYGELLQKYSSSSYAKDGKAKIKECRERLRNKESYVADFYFKTEVYDAARWRYLDNLSNFNDKDFRSHSMKRVVLSTYFLKEYEKCISYANNYSQHLSGSDKKKVNEYLGYCKNKLN